jgi:hypothetical protein
VTVPPRQTVSPLNYRTPIVDPTTGMPTLQFIQLLQKLTGNEDGTAADLSGFQAQIDTLDAEVTVIEGDITTIEGDIVALEAAKVPPGGATGEVLTKDSATDYDMSWQPGGGGSSGVYAPMVTGDLPGPELLATGDGQCIMAPVEI